MVYFAELVDTASGEGIAREEKHQAALIFFLTFQIFTRISLEILLCALPRFCNRLSSFYFMAIWIWINKIQLNILWFNINERKYCLNARLETHHCHSEFAKACTAVSSDTHTGEVTWRHAWFRFEELRSLTMFCSSALRARVHAQPGRIYWCHSWITGGISILLRMESGSC